MRWLIELFRIIFDMIYPRQCSGCRARMARTRENLLCERCEERLPRTNYIAVAENKMKAELSEFAEVQFEHVAAYLYFSKGYIVQNIIHEMKYYGRREIGSYFGEIIGNELIGTRFEEVDVVIPAPIHYFRLVNRGYNQCYLLAEKIAKKLGKVFDTKSLIRHKYRKTQTRLNDTERLNNAVGSYKLAKNHNLNGKHVLLIDDVCTSGATFFAMAKEILSGAKDVKISVLSLAKVK